MKDISDNTLITLLFVAIVISIVSGLMISQRLSQVSSITGFAAAAANATASLTVQTFSSITFSDNAIDWGSGGVNLTSGATACNLATLDNVIYPYGCRGFTLEQSGLGLENNGNTNLTVTLVSNVSAQQFIGGTSPAFQWNVTIQEDDSCFNSTSGLAGASVAITNTTNGFEAVTNASGVSEGKVICYQFRFLDASDTLNISINISIPYDAPTGYRSARITAFANAVG